MVLLIPLILIPAYATTGLDFNLNWSPPPSDAPNFSVNESCSQNGADSDDDFICNDWEYPSGLRIYQNGELYQYKCAPYGGPDDYCPHRYTQDDIYIEVDWLNSHPPSQLAVDELISIFESKTSDHDVTLHIQMDQNVSPTDVDDKKIDFNPTNSVMGNDEFSTVKGHYFGDGTSDSKTAKRQAFHYTLFVHKFDNVLETGLAEVQGNDMALARANLIGSGIQADVWEEELCHNLGFVDPIENDDCVDLNDANFNLRESTSRFNTGPTLTDIDLELKSDMLHLTLTNQMSYEDSEKLTFDIPKWIIAEGLSKEDLMTIEQLRPISDDKSGAFDAFKKKLVRYFVDGIPAQSQTSIYLSEIPREIPFIIKDGDGNTLETYHNSTRVHTPLYQTSTLKIDAGKVVCSPFREFVYIDKNNEIPTIKDAIPICVQMKDFGSFVERWQPFIAGGGYLCDANDFLTKHNDKHWSSPVDVAVLDNITDSFSHDGSKLDCKAWAEKHY